jgi:PAS domain S-box-containing protein
MKDKDKTKAQLIAELKEIRRLVSEFEKPKAIQDKVEEKHGEREQRGPELMKSLPQIICETDEKGVLTYINDFAFKSFGYTKKDFNEGLLALQMLAVEDRKRAASNMKRIMNEKRNRGSNEYTALRKDGTTFPVMIYSAPVIRKNKAVGLQSIIVDITERKKAEEALKEEAVQRRILVEQSRDGIVVLDQNGKVFEANQRYADMLGYSPEEVRQLHLWDWDTQHTPEQLQEMLRTVDSKGDHFETRHRRKDGTYYDVEISKYSAEALKSFDRKPTGYDLVITDLTMPEITGLDLAKHIHRFHPDLPVILMTGYGEKLTSDIQKHYGIREVIGKPIEIRDLAAAIRKGLDK